MNADSGAVIATLPIGEGTDFASFDPVRHLAFSSNRDGTLSVISEISPDQIEVVAPYQNQNRRTHDGTRSKEWPNLSGDGGYDDGQSSSSKRS